MQFVGGKLRAHSEADGGQDGSAQLPLEILALVLRVLQAHSQAGPPELTAEVAQLQHHALRSDTPLPHPLPFSAMLTPDSAETMEQVFLQVVSNEAQSSHTRSGVELG